MLAKSVSSLPARFPDEGRVDLDRPLLLESLKKTQPSFLQETFPRSSNETKMDVQPPTSQCCTNAMNSILVSLEACAAHPAVLAVTAARRRFGKTLALDCVGLELRQGECLGLLGPNGAGKTTLIRAIAGRVKLDHGQILLLGETVGNGHARPGLGMVPQDVALYPLLTARENLEVFGAFHGLSRNELRDRASWALQWTGLADRDGEPIKRFSGGMKRRFKHRLRSASSPQSRASRRADACRRSAEPATDLGHARRTPPRRGIALVDYSPDG